VDIYVQELLTSEEKLCVSNCRVKTGIDLVYIADMKDFLDSPVGILLTQNEWINLKDLSEPLQRMAGRFACQEAVMKVLGHGINEIDFVDIEIFNDDFGKPRVCLTGSALRYWNQTGLSQLDISISHHKDYAVAIAVALI
jgi:holo-[acyl-carrier protein] synthase